VQAQGLDDDYRGAQDKLVTFMASLFQRAGIATMAEFGDLLTVYADAVADTAPGEAAILKRWADGVRSAGVQ
jgi:hypothetical protein